MNRKYSLKKSHDIEKLIKLKQSVGNKYYAMYFQYEEGTRFQIAFSATKRFKTAVKRNYEKRVTREIFREEIDKLDGYKILVVVKEAVSELTFAKKQEQIQYLIRKMLRWKNEKAK